MLLLTNGVDVMYEHLVIYTSTNGEMADNPIVSVNKAFAGFFARVERGQKAGYPRFKGAGRFDSVQWPKDGDGARWLPEQRRVYLQGVGQLKVDVHRPVAGRVKTIPDQASGSALDAGPVL